MRISTNAVRNNMIIDEDIYNDNGGLIVSRGLSVSDEKTFRELLMKNGVKKVKVLLLSDSTEDKKSHLKLNYQIEDLPYDDEKKHEIETFINDFSNMVDSFENEIVNNLAGNCDRRNLENILEESMNKSVGKNTNIFQLLQKLKDTDDFTFVHCNSVALTAYTIGKWLKLPEDNLKELSLAALVFDIGKYAIPTEILMKTKELTDEEYNVVKGHVEKTVEMLSAYNLSENIINAIKFHHERSDGSGYPYGLKNEQIPTMAKIIALSDIYCALTSKRPYRDKYTPFQAIKILEENYMQKLDIVILSEFIKRIASNYLGNMVKLTNDLVGEVLFINSTAPLRPIIKINDTGELIDLSAKVNQYIDIKEFI